MRSLFERTAIIGFGSMGSSLALNIRKNGISRHIVAIDREKSICEKALSIGLADESATSIRKGIEGCDLVILAVPAGACGSVACQIRDSLKPGAIITDTVSVKETVIAAIMPYLPDKTLYVPAHPLASRSGFDSVIQFEKKFCIITPLPYTDIRAIEKITALWESCGSVIEITTPKRHDRIIAITSHIPHLLASTLVGTSAWFEYEMKQEIMKFSSPEFSDFARISSSDPAILNEDLLNNRDSVLEILNFFNRNLSCLQEGIEQGDNPYLKAIFSDVRAIGKRIADVTAKESRETREDAESWQKEFYSEA